jgi:hypothetical protein
MTPRLQESLVRLSTWMPFGRAAKELKYFTRVEVSEATARRITESAGSDYVGVQSEQVEEIVKQVPASPPGPELQLISADGAMVHEVSGEWVEVKTLAIGKVETKGATGDVHTRELTYFSRMSEASEFNRQALVEVFRRGTEKAGKVCAVNDGADWEQKFIDYHRPDAVRILDFAHAAGKVADAGRLIFGEESVEFKEWFNTQKHSLKLGKTASVLRRIRALEKRARGRGRGKKLKTIRGSVNYLEKRREMINYNEFQDLGYPIGSGCVESANKLVVESRMKQAGMRWARQNIDSILALRNIACNDRWEEAWPQLVKHRLDKTADRVQQRHNVASPVLNAIGPEIPSNSQQTVLGQQPHRIDEREVNEKTKQRGDSRPSAKHPWKQIIFGSARYRTPEGFTRAKS